VRDDDPLGKLYGLDVSIHDLDPKALPPGTAKRLRVLEGVPRRAGVASHPALAVRRFLGEVPLAEDGSFQVQIPANTPVQLQLLDADGLALRSSAWVWARNHANQGCVGCHEDPERTPPNRMVKALFAPAAVLDMPAERRRTVDYRRDVAPIVRTRCLSCHEAGGRKPRLDGVTERGVAGDPSADYEALIVGSVVPGEARRSRLIWHVLGRNTSRPWDESDFAKAFAAMPSRDPLTEEEKRTFVEWIDLGALWDAGTGGER
jgi:cytochrome c553